MRLCQIRAVLIVSAYALLAAIAAKADVTVSIGPTTIPRGDALGERDITVSNDLFSVAFAVDTAPPWGVARGGIVDIALIRDGKVTYDIASLADFMPNNWSSWPTSYQRVSVESASRAEVIVKTERDWGDVELVTTFRIRDADDKIHIDTHMTNSADAPLTGLYSGYVLWPDGGSLFGMPGLAALVASAEDSALGDWSASYGEHWAFGLHAPFSETFAYGGRDRYREHDLMPGESASFEAWVQIVDNGSLAPLVAADIDLRQLPSGRISGRVQSEDGEVVSRPALVVTVNELAYAWAVGSDGNYEFELPVGHYQIYATAGGYARGAARDVLIGDGGNVEIDFDDVRPPGKLHFNVKDAESKQSLDARISIQDGYRPLISYMGKNTFFTELNSVGEAFIAIAPGDYVFEVSAGGGFTSRRQVVQTTVESGRVDKIDVRIPVLVAPQDRGWYNADLHHHSDVLDGFTEAEFVMRSELAAGVDFTFLSDHDSVVNNREMRAMSDIRDKQFIPGTELSPSWAHFNAFPIDDGATVDIDTGQATAEEVFAAARRMGADLIEVNHPYSNYGYFESLEKGTTPDGFNSGFDLVEIQPRDHVRNAKTLKKIWQLWNEGLRVYLAAGSDVHDVWLNESGTARTYAQVDGDPSVVKFVASVRAGHSFASQGPLVFPDKLFGSEVQHRSGDTLALGYSVMAVSGLRSVQLVERGKIIASRDFDGETTALDADFSVQPNDSTWYSLVVEDGHGNYAYTNPLWVMVTN